MFIKFKNLRSNAWLWHDNLHEANLHEANLYGANLHGACLCETNLTNADLTDTDLTDTDLTDANLCRANLCRANLYGANLTGVNLNGANLYGANFSFASWPLWCSSFSLGKTDDRLTAQLVRHTLEVAAANDSNYGRAVIAALAPLDRFHKYKIGVEPFRIKRRQN